MENILCGRKLEFGDIYQIENRKELNRAIGKFITDLKKECDNINDLVDCEKCCGCEEYFTLLDTINFYKTNGSVIVGKLKDKWM
jgi:hypothetical protein